MGADQIGDMDVIANAGAVRGRIVGAEHVDLGALAKRGLDRDLDEVGCAQVDCPVRSSRVGPGDIEVAQDDVIEPWAKAASRSMISVISLDEP